LNNTRPGLRGVFRLRIDDVLKSGAGVQMHAADSGLENQGQINEASFK